VLFLSRQVTVGICAYNEAKNIGELLQNILYEQELSSDSEVLVVCSGCTDRTVEIVQKFSKSDSRVNLHLETKRRGKASAINYILSNASSNVILFISADTLPSQRCFARLIAKLETPTVGVVCGNPLPTNNTNSLVGKLVQLLWGLHGKVFAEYSKAGLARHATEAFCVRKGIVVNIPPETVNDDAYIAINARMKGWIVRFEPESSVLIHGPETFPEYFNQRRRVLWGHHQLKKWTSISPQHLIYLFPYYPARVTKLLLWLCSEYNPVSVVAFVSTELVVNAVAVIDVFRGKSYSIWKTAASTKTVIPQRIEMQRLAEHPL